MLGNPAATIQEAIRLRQAFGSQSKQPTNSWAASVKLVSLFGDGNIFHIPSVVTCCICLLIDNDTSIPNSSPNPESPDHSPPLLY
jgi:hypothetical protein